MRFESIKAHDFGPFHENTLHLAPGMNVVYGVNEAGKSSWHAALYLGLCGMRRSKRKGDREFADRHKPWDNSAWKVGAVVTLRDGRRIELRHDLARRVDSYAMDMDLASRDYSNEILFEGSPDGSRWLGLNRKSFLSTASVRQTDILRILSDADSLQQDMQRAADTAGVDATAAAALQRIEDFRREHVGSNLAPTKPMRVSAAAVRRAEDALASAGASHAEYLERLAKVEGLERNAQYAQHESNAMEAALAKTHADSAESRLNLAQELNALFSDGAPRPSPERDDLAEQVTEVLTIWGALPAAREPDGPSLEELQLELDEFDARVNSTPSTAPRGRKLLPLLVASCLAIVGGGVTTLALPDLLAVGAAVAGAGLAGVLSWLAMSRLDRQSVDARSEVVLDVHRMAIKQRLESRRNEQERYESDLRQRSIVLERLRETVAACDSDAIGPEAQAQALRDWRDRWRITQRERDNLNKRRGQLQSLLAGQSLEEIDCEAKELRVQANTLMAAADPTLLGDACESNITKEQLDDTKERAQTKLIQWEGERVRLEEFASNLRSVADAEDALTDTRHEQERVLQLNLTLGSTINYLKQAQERVHRDIAPILRLTVLKWLQQVTNGRYHDCKIDPKSLSVEVRDGSGQWRRAQLLSHGTAEQVYLLLRMSMAQHLTTVKDETCPLILDDVVSASDAERKRVVMETLLAISESTQVILFTHEDDVRDWARDRLAEPSNILIELPLEAIPASNGH